jgi:N-acetyl sugar amidotransferase
MKYCKRCILPDTRPGITIDDSGVCSGCHSHEFKEGKIDWSGRRNLLDEIVTEVKSRSDGYDCIVPVSGGKDSWYQLQTAKELGLTPLAVTWRTPARTAIGQRNIDEMIRRLGVDHIDYTVNPDVERLFMARAFEKKGDPGLPMHMAIFVIPIRLATQMRIPLILQGENPQLEFGGSDKERLATEITDEWLAKHGCMQGTIGEDWASPGLDRKDLQPYILPKGSAFRPRIIFLGAFIKWNSFKNAEVARNLGFTFEDGGARTGTWDFADIDCDFVSLHHYPKWHKFGMSRAFDNLSVQIRYGLFTREQAISRLRDVGMQTPRDDIRKFCDFVGKPERWFWDTCETFRNHVIWAKDGNHWKVRDFLISDFRWE